MVFVRKFKGPCSEDRVDCPVKFCPVTISKFRNLPKHLQTKHGFREIVIKSIVNQIRNCIPDVEDFCERNLPQNDSSLPCAIRGKIPPVIHCSPRRKNLIANLSPSTTIREIITTSTNDSRSLTCDNFLDGCSTLTIATSVSHPQLSVLDKRQQHEPSRVSRAGKGYRHVQNNQISRGCHLYHKNRKNTVRTISFYLSTYTTKPNIKDVWSFCSCI